MFNPSLSEQQAGSYFDSGYFGAESVLLAIAVQAGIESSLIPRVATGFCGGMARTNGPCGALTGGVMALGLVHGRNVPADSRDLNYRLVQLFREAFVREFGSTECSGVLGCDISTPEGTERFVRENLMKTVCARVTARAAGLAAEILETRV
jgi:C_GCAxxG_C_C family probable redox protein